jgi:hypothetical protein
MARILLGKCNGGVAFAGRGIVRTAETKTYVPSMSMRANVVRDEIKRMADVYVDGIETQIVEWGARLDELAARSEAGSSDVPVERRRAVADLVARYQATRTKLAAWKTLGKAKWGIHELRVEQAWNDLESAFENLRSGLSRED